MKLYVAIQRFLNKNWVHYIVLFFILISIVAVIASSFEEMSRYRLALFGITYISSFVFLLEYAARILSAPALHPTKSAIKARLLYTFSFYGFVDFVAILPCVLTYIYWNTEVVHIIILPYIFIIFKLIRHSRSFRLIGKALYSVREELATAYTASFITICFSAILMYYIERNPKHESLHEMLVAQIWRPTGWQMDDSSCAFPRSLLSGRCTEIPESPPYAFGLRRRFSVAAKNR